MYKGLTAEQYCDCAEEVAEAIRNLVEVQSKILPAFGAGSAGFEQSKRAAKALHLLRSALEQRAFDAGVSLSQTKLWSHGALIY